MPLNKENKKKSKVKEFSLLIVYPWGEQMDSCLCQVHKHEVRSLQYSPGLWFGSPKPFPITITTWVLPICSTYLLNSADHFDMWKTMKTLTIIYRKDKEPCPPYSFHSAGRRKEDSCVFQRKWNTNGLIPNLKWAYQVHLQRQ